MRALDDADEKKMILFRILEKLIEDMLPYLNIDTLMKTDIDQITEEILDPLTDFVGIKIKRLEIGRLSYDWLSERDITQEEILVLGFRNDSN